MEVWTYQISHARRLLGSGILLLDTTVKTGYPQVAPTWEMVMGHKALTITDDEYTLQYKKILNYWWFRDPGFFEWILDQPKIAFGCYCKGDGRFCHRHVLVDYLRPVASFDYRGELTQSPLEV